MSRHPRPDGADRCAAALQSRLPTSHHLLFVLPPAEDIRRTSFGGPRIEQINGSCLT
ncbi:hypothetical protein ACP70R_025596 [Stipagrostis hirtigluma subsp. patula]